jgi:hypothetical protein
MQKEPGESPALFVCRQDFQGYNRGSSLRNLAPNHMKNTASLLLTLVALTAVPVFAHSGDVKADKASKKVAKAALHHKAVTYYYITNATVAGSNIPVVVRKSGKDIDTSAPVTAYSRYDLDRTGGEDVGGELLAIDPAITFVRH